MTPKEKAEELVGRYAIKSYQLKLGISFEFDKQCALIVVDEMLSHTMNCDYGCAGHSYEFWNEVKNEIELL